MMSFKDFLKFNNFKIKYDGLQTMWVYKYHTNPKDILKGLEHFKKTYEFVNKDEINPEPIRKQKRND